MNFLLYMQYKLGIIHTLLSKLSLFKIGSLEGKNIWLKLYNTVLFNYNSSYEILFIFYKRFIPHTFIFADINEEYSFILTPCTFIIRYSDVCVAIFKIGPH